MTQEKRRSKPPELEPPLAELPRLRELAQLQVPTTAVKRAMYTRARHTLESSPPNVPGSRAKSRARAWLVAVGTVVAVPSAFAATPAGGFVVERATAWATRAWTVVELATAKVTFQTPAEQPRVATVGSTLASHIGSDVPPTAASNAMRDQVGGSIPKVNAASGPSVQPAVSVAVSAPAPGSPPFSAERLPVSHRPGIRLLAPSNQVSATPSQGANISAPSNSRTPEQPLTLNQERELLVAARLRLRAGDTGGALMLAERHGREFPNGMLTVERQAIIRAAQQHQARDPR